MKSGDHRRGRAAAGDPAQASIDGLLPAEASDETPAEAAPADAPQPEPRGAARKSAKTGGPARKRAAAASEREPESLRDSVDRLEENVTLLLARHGEILAAHAAAEKRRGERKSLDPIELQDRVRALEQERERLDRHAAFLEDRIRGLLSRVRYVVES